MGVTAARETLDAALGQKVQRAGGRGGKTMPDRAPKEQASGEPGSLRLGNFNS